VEEQNAVGVIPDESFEVSAMDSSAKEFLSDAIDDYNAGFKTNFHPLAYDESFV
jgi:type I restriction enzyme R subunit